MIGLLTLDAGLHEMFLCNGSMSLSIKSVMALRHIALVSLLKSGRGSVVASLCLKILCHKMATDYCVVTVRHTVKRMFYSGTV